MRLKSIPRLVRRLASLPNARRRLLAEAAFWLIVARISILFVAFPRIARHLGSLQAPGIPQAPGGLQTSGSEHNGSEKDQWISREVAWAIERSAIVLPVKMVCLPRALAGWQMLHRRGIAGRIHFGASRAPEGGGLLTHAWLDASGVEVSGYPEAYACVEMGHFSR